MPVIRLIAWLLARTIYRLRVVGPGEVPRTGPALMVVNHVSFIDWFVLAVVTPRPIRFVMHVDYYRLPVVHWVFRLAKAVPIATGREDPQVKSMAFARVEEALNAGELVCIFPEGLITHDGNVGVFRPGVERMLATHTDVPVIPVALRGLWGSFFSRYGGRAILKVPRPSRRLIEIAVGTPLPTRAKAAEMRDAVVSVLVSTGSPRLRLRG